MREIKFRGYKKGKGMTINRTLQEWCETYAQFVYDTRCNQSEHLNSVIFMQYTGLKDKNGTEIYEGDIIKHKLGVIKTVYFKNGAFMLSHLLSDLVIGDGWLLEWRL